jgi:hypothetical protein
MIIFPFFYNKLEVDFTKKELFNRLENHSEIGFDIFNNHATDKSSFLKYEFETVIYDNSFTSRKIPMSSRHGFLWLSIYGWIVKKDNKQYFKYIIMYNPFFSFLIAAMLLCFLSLTIISIVYSKFSWIPILVLIIYFIIILDYKDDLESALKFIHKIVNDN